MTDNATFKAIKEGHITWLILNQPGKRNAMDFEFFSDIEKSFTMFSEDPEVHVVIIKAEGKSFTAGIDFQDLSSFLKGEGADFREEIRKKILQLQKSINTIEKCHKPVIAAVHGHCIGGGVDLISACDIRMSTRDAIFSIRETRMAIIADLGTLQRLPLIIGDGWFRELALTGRDFTGDEALKIGLITHLCEDRNVLYEEAQRLATEIASCSPLAVQGVKDVILYSRDSGVYPGLEYVAQKNASLLQSEDLIEAFRAFKEKRPPEFEGK